MLTVPTSFSGWIFKKLLCMFLSACKLSLLTADSVHSVPYGTYDHSLQDELVQTLLTDPILGRWRPSFYSCMYWHAYLLQTVTIFQFHEENWQQTQTNLLHNCQVHWSEHHCLIKHKCFSSYSLHPYPPLHMPAFTSSTWPMKSQLSAVADTIQFICPLQDCVSLSDKKDVHEYANTVLIH